MTIEQYLKGRATHQASKRRAAIAYAHLGGVLKTAAVVILMAEIAESWESDCLVSVGVAGDRAVVTRNPECRSGGHSTRVLDRYVTWDPVIGPDGTRKYRMLKSFGHPQWVLMCAISLSVFSPIWAQDAQGDQQKEQGDAPAYEPVGYFLGLSLGQQMSSSGFRAGDFDLQALMAGFKDGIENKEAALTDDQLRETQMKIQALIQQRHLEMQQKAAQQGKIAKEKGEAFLAENAKKEGVKTLPGGVQYKVLTEGKGESPSATDTVKVHYTGKLINGEVFDSSVARGEPATFRVNQVIPGWQMSLKEMKVGDKWMLYIPAELAYGERGAPGGSIGPNEVLVFEVELLGVQ